MQNLDIHNHDQQGEGGAMIQSTPPPRICIWTCPTSCNTVLGHTTWIHTRFCPGRQWKKHDSLFYRGIYKSSPLDISSHEKDHRYPTWTCSLDPAGCVILRRYIFMASLIRFFLMEAFIHVIRIPLHTIVHGHEAHKNRPRAGQNLAQSCPKAAQK